MKQHLIIGLILVCISSWVSAQNGLSFTQGARSIALGKTGVTFKNVNALLNNPAGLSFLEDFSALVAAEQRFATEELRTVAGGLALPTAGGTFSLSVQYFGFDLYNEQRLGLGYSRLLTPDLSLGVQFLLHNTQIEEYGSKFIPTFELGLLYSVTDQITVGGQVINPTRQEVVPDEFLPTELRLGISYQSSESVLFILEAAKDIEYPVQVRAGIEYRVIDMLYLRTGISTEPTLWSFGVGYYAEKSGLQIDFGASQHQFLGISPALSISYR